jgi:PAS domain S-box-containing protein
MLIQENYFKNIFNTIREGILILDENMRVLSANRSFLNIFKVDSANTVGFLLYDLGNGQWNIPELRVMLEEILPKDDTVDGYEIEHIFESIGQKTMLLNACKIREENNDLPVILLAIEDITERRLLENLLTESEERYRRIFETASDGIVLLEKRRGNITHANPAAEKMLGYSKEECIGKNLQDIGVSLDMCDFSTIMQTLSKNGTINYDDVQVKTKSGQDIYTDIYMVDRARLAQCTIRDVTERQQKDKNIQRLNRVLLARSESSKAMMSARDEEWYLNEVCRIIVEDCGHALVWIGFAEKDEGKTIRPAAHFGIDRGYLDTIHITWADSERGQGPAGTAIRTTKPSIVRDISGDIAFELWREDAVKRGYAAIISVPLLTGGKAFGSLNIYSRHRDPFSEDEVRLLNDLAEDLSYGITAIRLRTAQAEMESALRKSERKYKSLVETTIDGVYQSDSEGFFTFINQAGAEIFGYGAPDEMMSKAVIDYWVDPGERIKFVTELKNKKTQKSYPLRAKKKDGVEIQLEMSSHIIEDDLGRFTGIEGILRDVTERKKLEAQLRHSQKMEAVGTLAGGIAHDFNNILNVIIGYGLMVLDSLKADSPSKKHMNEVLTAADRAANLTKRLLGFSRKQVFEVKLIDINEVILNLQKMLVRIISESIDFKVILANKPLIVLADAGQIELVLINLVTNAKDAMQESGRLTISSGFEDVDDEHVVLYGYGKPGRYALITVSDTGHGMDGETQKKIFEPFFTTKGIGEGTGLGLAISYGIIKQHDGYIKVSSEPGQGTIFKIYLPLRIEAASPVKKMEVAFAVKGGNETVLVAEDDASLRSLTSIVLESFGYNVVLAVDGEDAITKFMENKEQISLVLLDTIMPKKNGKEVSDTIKEVIPRIKMLFTSGYSMDMTEFGFDFIQKPFLPKDLLLKVREVLDR